MISTGGLVWRTIYFSLSCISVILGLSFAIFYIYRFIQAKKRVSESDSTSGSVPDICLRCAFSCSFLKVCIHLFVAAICLFTERNSDFAVSGIILWSLTSINQISTFGISLLLTIKCIYRYIFNCSRSWFETIENLRARSSLFCDRVFLSCPGVLELFRPCRFFILWAFCGGICILLGLLQQTLICAFLFVEQRNVTTPFCSPIGKRWASLGLYSFLIGFCFAVQSLTTIACVKKTAKRLRHLEQMNKLTKIANDPAAEEYRRRKVIRLLAERRQSFRLLLVTLSHFVTSFFIQITIHVSPTFLAYGNLCEVLWCILYYVAFLMDLRIPSCSKASVEPIMEMDGNLLSPRRYFAFAEADRRSFSVAFSDRSTMETFDPREAPSDVIPAKELARFVLENRIQCSMCRVL